MASGKLEGSFPMELNPLHDLERLILDLADTIFYSCNPYGGLNLCSPGARGRAIPSAHGARRRCPRRPTDSLPPCSSPGQRGCDPAHPWPAASQLW